MSQLLMSFSYQKNSFQFLFALIFRQRLPQSTGAAEDFLGSENLL